MARRSLQDIEKIWSDVEGVKKLSDRAVSIGPFGVGLDALLTWIPVVGTLYTVGTGGWLILQATRVGASRSTLAKMAGYMGVDAATGSVPVFGDIVDTFFPGQLLAARALQAEIESTHWVEDAEASARASGDHECHLETVRRDPALRRIVYLHD